jgi:outer membrane receptor protein involved in Fe transport
MSQHKYAAALMGLTISLSMSSAYAADAKTGQLEEIVVTATRHEESLSKVPISVTAMTQESLDVKGIKDFQDVVRFTPGVTIDNTGTNAISIRGISSSGGAGTTGIYIDDTPIQMRAVGFSPDDALPKTFDLDRVEVLRGPQGTLFGSGSEGGTVRYIMNQPSVSKESTYVRSELSTTRGGDPSFEAGIAHGGPLIDGVLGYRASIWYRHDGGWIDRVDPTSRAVVDSRANRNNAAAVRLAFLWQPSEAVSITPSVMYQNSRKHDQSTFWDAYSDAPNGRFANASPERIPTPDEYYLPALKIEVDVGKTRVISNTSYYHRKEETGYQGSVYDLAFYQSQAPLTGSCGNYAGDPLNGVPCSWYPLIDGNGIHLPSGYQNYAGPNLMTNKQDSFTQELRWQSNDPSSRLIWTVGAFFSTSKERSTEALFDPRIESLWGDLLGTAPADFFGTTDYTCNDGNPNGYQLPNCASYLNDQTVTDRQIAIFGEGTYALSDRLKLTVGGRFAHQSFELNHIGDGYLNFGRETASASHSENAFTPKVGLSFQMDPANLYYFTYAKGFRPGGGNSPLPSYCNGDGGLNQTGYPNGAPSAYNSDTTQSYEIGTKNNPSSRLRIASSVYYIKWQNIQQSVYVSYNCGLQFTDNLGSAVAKGFDLQVESVLGGGFSLDAAIGYTSARYTESTAAPRPLLASSGDAISGEGAVNGSPASSPPWTVSLGLQYNFGLGERDAFVRMDWEYAAQNRWLTSLQDPATAQYNPYVVPVNSTSFASLRAGVSLGNASLAVFVDNLFDSRTITNYQLGQSDYNIPVDANNNYLWNQPTPQRNSWTFHPRTIGLSFTYRM